jgi:hypothetical protein
MSLILCSSQGIESNATSCNPQPDLVPRRYAVVSLQNTFPQTVVLIWINWDVGRGEGNAKV